MGDLRVTAGYVTVETAVGTGRARIDIPRGAVLPDDVPKEDRERLLGLGHVEPVNPAGDAEDEPAAPDGGADEPVPEGSIAVVLGWVKGDPRKRAPRALEAEQAKGETARSTLLAELSKIVEGSLELSHVEPVNPAGDAEDEPDGGADEPVPEGSIAVVLGWVTEDPGKRAPRALEAEQAKGETARSTLLAELSRIVAGE